MTAARDWTGRVVDRWAAERRPTDRSFADLAPHLHATILAAATDRGQGLDIGCGAGAATLALAQTRQRLHVLSVDLSA